MGSNGELQKMYCSICNVLACSHGYSNELGIELFTCKEHLYFLDEIYSGEGSDAENKA